VLSQVVAHPALFAAPLISSPVPTGLTPSQVRQAYGVNQISYQNGTIVGDGAGQTIAIVVAYDDPNIGTDLKQFDRQYGLSDPPSFMKYVQTGPTQTDSGWSLETSLDVEWAHAMAPKANLVLVEAGSASFSDLFGAVNFARSLNGVVAVSMSWGSAEFYGESAYDGLFTTPAGHLGGNELPGGITFVAASGDGGAWSGVSYPASSPNVLSVGATSLQLGAGSSYAGEQGWIGSTGGYSALEPAPAFQTSAQASSGLSHGLRTTPDVSAVGDPSTGVSTYDTVPYAGQSGWFAVGGTSAAAPQWSGLIAVADQGLALAGKGSLANAQAALYSIPSSAFHDVTSGFNGYSAKSGYDLVTGLGTPVANRVVAGLLAKQGVFNVTGFPAPGLPKPLPAVTVHTSLTLVISTPAGSSTSSDGSNTTGVSTIGSTGTTSLFPTTTTVIVIVVPVGSSQIVVILPAINPASSLFASNSHPIQPQVSTTTALPGSTVTTLNRFGQLGAVDTVIARSIRAGNELEIADLIDFVEPFQPPVPGRAPAGPAAPAEIKGAALPRLGYPTRFQGLNAGMALDEASTGRSPDRAAVPLSAPTAEQDLETTSAGARIASAAVIAGAGCWLALRESSSRRRQDNPKGTPGPFRPRLRRLTTSPR
jgi:subtilase family serine protease